MSKAALFQKIHKVMQDIGYLQKDDKVSMGNSGGYKAISEEKVTMTVRESLIKHGLVILPIEQEHHREGTLSTVNTKYEIIDIETGESKIIVSSGTGADTQDKGVGKAMTYSYKYLLLRTFAIPTGEDPDKVSSYDLDELEKQRRAKQEGRQTEERPNPSDHKQNASTGQPAASNGALATEGQAKMINVRAKQIGCSFERISDNLGYDVKTGADVKKADVNKVLGIIDALKEAVGAP